MKGRQKTKFAIALGILIVLCALVGILAITHSINRANEQAAEQSAVESTQQVGVDALGALYQSGYDDAVQVFQDKIASSTDRLEKISTTLQYAVFVLQNKENSAEEAIQIAKSVDGDIHSNDNSLRHYYNTVLYDAYVALGDEEQSNYYKAECEAYANIVNSNNQDEDASHEESQ